MKIMKMMNTRVKQKILKKLKTIHKKKKMIMKILIIIRNYMNKKE